MTSPTRKIVTVVGARPQIIKAAIMSRVMSDSPDVRQVLIHTGQHYDESMSEAFFRELNIPAPQYQLGIGSGTHGAQTGRMLEMIEDVLEQERPDWLLAHGDSNSTLAAALAAVKLHIPVARVEAGLRSHNRRMPEEINRKLTDHSSALLFSPTQSARKNLLREGFDPERTFVVGDVLYDAALHFAPLADRPRPDRSGTILESLKLTAGNYLLTTIHRAENTDDPHRLSSIFNGLQKFNETMPVVIPLHPRTRHALYEYNMFESCTRGLRVVEPVGYLDMITLEKHARLIATDSSGVQKEAYFYRVPCVTLRNETEWMELVDSGWTRLCPPVDGESIALALTRSIDAAGQDRDLYGNGEACRAIVNMLRDTDLDKLNGFDAQASPVTLPLPPRSMAG